MTTKNIPNLISLRILNGLLGCRGLRAYPSTLFYCLHDEYNQSRPGDFKKDLRRLHNCCASLFRQGLVEKVRGMYQLTPAGVNFLGKRDE